MHLLRRGSLRTTLLCHGFRYNRQKFTKKLRLTGSQVFSCKFRHFYFRCSILIDNITKVEDIMELGVAAFLCSVSSFLC